jgi:hypothetical protein
MNSFEGDRVPRPLNFALSCGCPLVGVTLVGVTLRKKNGRVVVDVPAAGRKHGRVARIPPASPAVTDAAELARHYLAACLSREFARRTSSSESTQYRSALRQAGKIAARLGQLPQGRDLLTRANTALGSRAVRSAITLASRAHADGKAFAIEAAATLAEVLIEHDVRSASALMMIGGAAAKTAAANMCFALALEKGPSLMSVTRGKKTDDGTQVSAQLAAFEPLLRAGINASNSARVDVLSALDLEKQSRDARPGVLTQHEFMARVAEAGRARRALAEAESAKTPGKTQGWNPGSTFGDGEAPADDAPDEPPKRPQDEPDDAMDPEGRPDDESPGNGNVVRERAYPDPDAARVKQRHDAERLRQELLAGQEANRQRAKEAGIL